MIKVRTALTMPTPSLPPPPPKKKKVSVLILGLNNIIILLNIPPSVKLPSLSFYVSPRKEELVLLLAHIVTILDKIKQTIHTYAYLYVFIHIKYLQG